MRKKLLFVTSLAVGAFVFSQTTIFKEDFETEQGRSSWVKADLDGDGETWEFDDSEVDAFTGYYATSWSWFFEAFTPDNTLTSPVIKLPKNQGKKLSLKFDIGAYDDELFQEHYAVYVIPANSSFTGSEKPIFEETLDAGYMNEAKYVTVDISEFAGQDVQLVFRHYDCTDLLVLMLDNIEVLEENKLSVADSNSVKLKLYPNPATDILKIDGIKTLDKVRIFDMSGKMVKEVTTKDIDIKSLAPGQYIVNVYSGKEVISNKIIKK